MQQKIPRTYILGYTVLVLAAIIWGTEAIVVKLCYAGGFSVISLLSLRYIASLPVFAAVVGKQKEPLLPPRHLLKPLLLLSLNVVAGVLTLYISLALLPATLAILFFYAYPSFTSLLHIILKRGSLGLPRVLALLISALGLTLLYWSSVTGLSALGVACALLSALLQAFKLIQTATLLPHISSPRLNFFTALFTALTTGLFYLFYAILGKNGFGLGSIAPLGWLSMLILGMVVTVLGNLFMTSGINLVGAVDTSLVLLLEPLTTAVLAFIVFGDKLSPWQTLGGFLILIAVALPAAANLLRRGEQNKEVAADESAN